MYNQAIINQLMNECADSIEDLLTELGVSYRKNYRRITGVCPIHCGDNQYAWNMYPDGDSVKGYWVCRTHNCHKKWGSNLIGFVRGVLSTTEKSITFDDAVRFMLKFLGYKNISEIKTPTQEVLARRAHTNAIRRLNITPNQKPTTNWTREDLCRILQIPDNYFTKRGYKQEMLSDYCVGYYPKQERVLVPVFDDANRIVCGFVGRSIYDKCEKCGLWHSPAKACPTTQEDIKRAAKWRNSLGFNTGDYLYNYNNAREHIIKTGTIIIVEGVADVWRLVEAGFPNCVALFGVNMTEAQTSIIESSWAQTILLALDNDEAGQMATNEIEGVFKRTFRVLRTQLPDKVKDIGELSTMQIKELFNAT